MGGLGRIPETHEGSRQWGEHLFSHMGSRWRSPAPLKDSKALRGLPPA